MSNINRSTRHQHAIEGIGHTVLDHKIEAVPTLRELLAAEVEAIASVRGRDRLDLRVNVVYSLPQGTNPDYRAHLDFTSWLHLVNLNLDAIAECTSETLTVRTAATITTSERGFKYGEEIPSNYGGHISVSESSNASGPHIWVRTTSPVDLDDPHGVMQEGIAHLALDDAIRLRDQLAYLIEHHYQVS